MLSRSVSRVARNSTSIRPLVTSKHVAASYPFSSQAVHVQRASAFTASKSPKVYCRQLSQLVHQVQREVGSPTSSDIEALPLRPSESLDSDPEPLRILFCGSDELSATVLRALYAEHLAHPSLIESISVFHRPGKPHGRGQKKLTIPVLRTVAEELQIPSFRIHEQDTFTGWAPPIKPDLNLIISVSFGLLVPPRILNSAKYGGLNIHPSLVPDLRGCSPIQSAILNGDKETGITLQDLDPSKFDHGRILARLRVPIPSPETITNAELTQHLAQPAAQLLVYGLRNGLYQNDRAQELPEIELGHQPREAKKLHKNDALLRPSLLAKQVCAIKRALGQVWFVRKIGGDKKRGEVRVVLDDLSVQPLSSSFRRFLDTKQNDAGEYRALSVQYLENDGTEKVWTRPMRKCEDGKSVEVYLGGDEVLKIGEATLSGSKKESAAKALWAKDTGKIGAGKEGESGLPWLMEAMTFGVVDTIGDIVE